MSPVIKKKNERFSIPTKYLLFGLSVACLLLMLITFGTNAFNRPLNSAVGYVVVPFQRGISSLGEWISKRSEEIVQIRELIEENESLKDQIAELTEQNTVLQQDKYELNSLRDLLKLDAQYDSYDKVGARIISKDSGNWYSTFIIDKGSNDGIELDMNVIAGGGLVGRVTSVGANWAKVTAIISDDSNTSGMIISTRDNLIVHGSLSLMENGYISFSQLMDIEDKIVEGDKIVTSNISDKYLPNILIGYVSYIERDANNLTKSGYVTPAVDFRHLSEVLVITDSKESIEK